jgi:CRISPR-associated protein Cas1
MERVIDLSEEGANLRVRNAQLIIRVGEREESVPLVDLLVLVVAHPAVCYTHAVLTGVCEFGGAVVLCDRHRMPAGMLLPYGTNFVQSERLAAQINLSVPAKKQLWKQVVTAKILAQAKTLAKHRGDDDGLSVLVDKVTSGDEGNVEGIAAQRYWRLLFGDDFRRRPQSDDPVNTLLDYGYGVLRAITARALCAAGLHPSLGIHHHNRYDAFCLADDLMEPFRPLVDDAVAEIVIGNGAEIRLDKQSKAILIGRLVVRRYTADGELRRLSDIVNMYCSSLVSVAQGKTRKLHLPELKDAEETTDPF